MNLKELGENLGEFLAAPVAVEKTSPEFWLNVWQHVCAENCEWLEMRDGTPYCKLCDRVGIFLRA